MYEFFRNLIFDLKIPPQKIWFIFENHPPLQIAQGQQLCTLLDLNHSNNVAQTEIFCFSTHPNDKKSVNFFGLTYIFM